MPIRYTGLGPFERSSYRPRERWSAIFVFHSRPDPDYLRPFARYAVEFGYYVFSDYRRHGYAAEAAGAAMDWAHAAFGISRFIVCVSPNNTQSLALIARLGFAKIGEHADEIDGIEHIYLRSGR